MTPNVLAVALALVMPPAFAATRPAPAPIAPVEAPAVEQGPAGSTGVAVPVSAALAPFAWLEGCWKGDVNHREFREFWMPARGNVMIGVGQLSWNGAMQDYQYLRLEAKDGVVFSQFSGDRKPYAFKLVSTATDEKDTVFTFDHTEATFPEHLVYRRGAGGWLYETVEGTLDGKPKTVIYPLHRVDCETGELVDR